MAVEAEMIWSYLHYLDFTYQESANDIRKTSFIDMATQYTFGRREKYGPRSSRLLDLLGKR